MKIPHCLLFICGVALLSGGCGPLPGKPTPADVPIAPGQVRDFTKLYNLNCAGCHGPEGKGSGALALANPVYLAIASDDVLRAAITKGIPGTLMPAFAESEGGFLVDEQTDVLVHGIRAWANPGALENATPPPYAASTKGDAQRGREVFTTFCVACHGPEGKGAEKSGSIVDGSFLALVGDQSLRNTIIAGRPDRGHPDWQHCLPDRALTDQEVTDIVAWLAAQRTATPGRPYTQTP